MLNADPANPVWGPMCSWGPGYCRWGGAGGCFVGWGPVLSVRDPTDKKTVSAGGKLGAGGECFGSSEPRNFLTLTMLGSVEEFFGQFAIYWFLGVRGT